MDNVQVVVEKADTIDEKERDYRIKNKKVKKNSTSLKVELWFQIIYVTTAIFFLVTLYCAFLTLTPLFEKEEALLTLVAGSSKIMNAVGMPV